MPKDTYVGPVVFGSDNTGGHNLILGLTHLWLSRGIIRRWSLGGGVELRWRGGV